MSRLRIAAARACGLVLAAVVVQAGRPPRPSVSFVAGLALLAALGLALAGAPPARAAEIVVNDLTTEATAADGKCPLAEALNNAAYDNRPAGGGPNDCAAGTAVDTIRFNIPDDQCTAPGGVCRIAIGSTYNLIQPITLDGYSQPGASPNTQAVGSNVVLKIEVTRGGNWTGDGLRVAASNVTIRGLTLTGFRFGSFSGRFGAGVLIDTASSNVTIAGNHIGVDPTGTTAAGNDYGIYGTSLGANVVIGGTTPEARNVISGSSNRRGIFLTGTGSGTRIVGNYIGTNAAGSDKVPNFLGVELFTTSGVVIGGTTPGARNVISGSELAGVLLFGNADGTVVQGNSIGTDATGTSNLGNGVGIRTVAYGVDNPDDSTIGGTDPGAGNVITFNDREGLVLNDSGVGNAILGNRIFANGGLGIRLGGTAPTPNDVGDGDFGTNRSRTTRS